MLLSRNFKRRQNTFSTYLLLPVILHFGSHSIGADPSNCKERVHHWANKTRKTCFDKDFELPINVHVLVWPLHTNMERLWFQKGGQCIKNLDFIVWPPGTAKVGCKRTKIDCLSILEGEVNSCCYKLLTFVLFDWITCQKICKYTPMLPFLTDLVWVWVKMSMKLPNSCWLTDAALTLQSLLSSGTTHTSKSVIFQVLKWTGNPRWRWPWNQSPGLKMVICRPMGDIAMTTFLLCSDTQEINDKW